MKIANERKQSILIYILQKIDQGEEGLQESVSTAYGIDRATVYKYLKELLERGTVEKKRRGKYELKTYTYSFHLKRSEGDFENDTYAYNRCLKDYIKDLDSNVIGIWNYVISEMYNNVIDHSQAENAIVTIWRNALKTTVMIADDGVGIFRKIQEEFGLPTLEDAIIELFKGKLTTDSLNHSGEGIFFSSKMVDEFYILSDNKVFTNNKYDISRLHEYSGSETKGTAVIMTLNNYSNKKMVDIFDFYADVDGGFTKTIMPMKNMFEPYPVSRSQAKRLCERLNEFKEAIIDFEGVEFMGQGFAHQLFVVYARQHPDVELKAVHMNDNVGKMYRHVTETA